MALRSTTLVALAVTLALVRSAEPEEAIPFENFFTVNVFKKSLTRTKDHGTIEFTSPEYCALSKAYVLSEFGELSIGPKFACSGSAFQVDIGKVPERSMLVVATEGRWQGSKPFVKSVLNLEQFDIVSYGKEWDYLVHGMVTNNVSVTDSLPVKNILDLYKRSDGYLVASPIATYDQVNGTAVAGYYFPGRALYQWDQSTQKITGSLEHLAEGGVASTHIGVIVSAGLSGGDPSGTLGDSESVGKFLGRFYTSDAPSVELPWPLPTPTLTYRPAWTELGGNEVAPKTLGDVATLFVKTVKRGGFDSYGFYLIPGGFALALPLE